MKKQNSLFFISILLFFQAKGIFLPNRVHAQTSTENPRQQISSLLHEADSFLVKHVYLEGNKKTKDRIILRELDLLPGSKIGKSSIEEYLETERNKIFNTNLFVSTDITYQEVEKDTIDVTVKVLERWYFWPFPLFELADRNFNEWWNNRGRSLNRLNYGILFTQKNFRGRGETLKTRVELGFTRKISLLYQIPFIDKKQSWGFSSNVRYQENKVFDYATIRNRGQDTSRNEEIMFRGISVDLSLSKRIGFYDFHTFGVSYVDNHVDDLIAQLNASHYLNKRTEQQYFSLSYTYRRDRRDFQRYPLRGYFSRFNLIKHGLGVFNDVNIVSAEFVHARYYNLWKKLYWNTLFSGKVSGPEEQPYQLNRAMGFGSLIVRGYDNYVIEGEHIGVFKNEIKWQLLKKELNFEKVIPWKEFSIVPLEIYPKVYVDFGRVVNSNTELVEEFENGRLTNRWLTGMGAGVDIVTFYSTVVRLEYSYNPIDKRAGFFLYYEVDL